MAIPSAVPPAAHARSGVLALSTWCIVAAFGTYFCMYAFRKPFTAAAYDAPSYKATLITAQVLGYAFSKVLSVRIVAQMRPQDRAGWILALIGAAQLALFFFALVPAPYNAACLFCNGLPLGMVFGLVLGFLEGRQVTEALTAGLCASFIVADGVMKSVGAYLLQAGVTEAWMPFTAGLVFAAPLVLFVWMLTRIPLPSPSDVAARSERVPMRRPERRRFFWRYAPGLSLLVLAYLLITILRSVRADFAPELWRGLGTTGQPDVFTRSEALVALGVILCNGLAVFIRDNGRAFSMALLIAASGLVLIGLALAAFHAGWLSPFALMVLLGLGLYLPYVAVHTTLFERLIAMTRDRGNLAYLMCLADAVGYLGYVAVMLAGHFWDGRTNLVDLFFLSSALIAAASLAALVACWCYFAWHPTTAPALRA
jgi:hypothetical protein